MPDTYAVILAGGAGTRLWPLSRRNKPKQLLRLFEGRSLLQHAVDRLAGLFEPDKIRIVTTTDLVEPILNEIDAISVNQIIAEPALRDTANAIGLAANLIAREAPDAVMCIFTADQLITPRGEFQDAIRTGIDAAASTPDALITFGIPPASAHTGYGYLELGEHVDDRIRTVDAFREKPDAETAARYVSSGRHLWNSGMFAWRVETILNALQTHLPENQRTLSAIAADWKDDVDTEPLRRRYEGLTRISIDYAVLEKADRVLVVPMTCDWLDVGSWEAVAALHAADASGNVAIGAHSVAIDSNRNTLAGEPDHLIVTIGVDDLIVVHTADATLVCRKVEAQRVRDVVEKIRAECGRQFD